MISDKSCPRCQGCLIVDRDQYGFYEECLQCGHHRDLPDMMQMEQADRTGRKEPTNA